MAAQDDVRRVALSRPETAEDDGYFALSVANGAKRRRFAWVWSELIGGWRCQTPPAFVDELTPAVPRAHPGL